MNAFMCKVHAPVSEPVAIRPEVIDLSVSGRFSPVSSGTHKMTIDWLID